MSSDDPGKTFENRIRSGNAVEGYSEFSPHVASSSDGTIHVAWISGKISLPLSTDADTFYSRIGKTEKDLSEQSLQIYASPLK